jgi:hypothetical protein
MDKSNGLDRKNLQTQIENYKLIAEVNSVLFDEHPSAKEELAKRVAVAQGCIDEAHQWEELGDHTKSYDALSNAHIIIVEVNAVIKYLLSQTTSLDDNDLEWGQSSVYG